jgi:hypothetical protein
VPNDPAPEVASGKRWYIGLPPTRVDNTAHKAAPFHNALPVQKLDGVHFGFVRWPGFWEPWLPDVNPAAMSIYSLDTETVATFLLGNWSHREGFGRGSRAHPDGRVARRQHAALLTRRVRRRGEGGARTIHQGHAGGGRGFRGHGLSPDPTPWRGVARTDRVLHRIPGRRQPSHLHHPSHAALSGGNARGHGRASRIDAREFASCVEAVAASGAPGLCAFTLADLLAMRGRAEGEPKLAALAAFRRQIRFPVPAEPGRFLTNGVSRATTRFTPWRLGEGRNRRPPPAGSSALR